MKTILAAVETYGLLNEMPVRDGLLERREGENVCMKVGHIAYIGNGVKKKRGWKGG